MLRHGTNIWQSHPSVRAERTLSSSCPRSLDSLPSFHGPTASFSPTHLHLHSITSLAAFNHRLGSSSHMHRLVHIEPQSPLNLRHRSPRRCAVLRASASAIGLTENASLSVSDVHVMTSDARCIKLNKGRLKGSVSSASRGVQLMWEWQTEAAGR